MVTLEKRRTETIPINSLNEKELGQISRQRLLSLSLEEMRAIQSYFKSEGRDPTDVELETIAQTWSEHCKHKTFKGRIEYVELKSGREDRKVYEDLFRQTIAQATQKLNKKFCLSVFEDNAGMIAFDEKWAIAFKAETHNHPSALEPYGGAGTGIGGVIRDILGAGLGAKPILNTDVFCVGEFGKVPPSQEPSSNLPPERVLSGVIAGVRDYGNRMGIPTANGAVLFHEGYFANPLVFCGTVGLIPRNCVHKQVVPGDWVVSIGGRTGRDGIHGATFSSAALEDNIAASVVQIGNAIVEKKVADALLRARDLKLYNAVTDCGAGGFSSSVGELAADCGVKVSLETAPLKYQGLSPWEIWLSESQERMVFSVPRENLDSFQAICSTENVECAVIGEFTKSGRLEVFYRDEKVCDLDLGFLHKGIPQVRKKAVWSVTDSSASPQNDLMRGRNTLEQCGVWLKKLVAHPNIASKRWIVQQYDHEVQGGSVIKPFVGKGSGGPSDAAVIRPRLDSWKGIVVSNGINPFYGEIDPYWMAANAIDESLRNLVAVGGDLKECALLDNFCWGDVENERILAGLVRCAQGCHDFAISYGVPFISGKDSLNNTWRDAQGQVVSIPGTLLISAISVVQDVRQCVTMNLKKPGNFLYLVGETRDEMGGSHLYRILNMRGGEVPKVNGETSLNLMQVLSETIRRGWISACHDVSEGGLGVALAECCFAGGLGARVDIGHLDQVLLFSESATRWIIEVEPKNAHKIQKRFGRYPLQLLGRVQKEPSLRIQNGKQRLDLSVEELKKLWERFSQKQ
ncbi:MAG: phosphoribosylformylglycinamidine synthase subunit PurL [Elusimicrobia bacterium]|nr:phosphoribosylformylglycinamidine synthase subunit PurL [Elusimicrobiota bacterium]